ncbi:MAG: DUF805 domain-containing protein [Caulobacteraceae bacterium]
MLMKSIRHNLVRLIDFSGREDRALFWPYAGAVFAAVNVIGVAAISSIIVASMTRIQRFVVAHPDQASVAVGPESYAITIHGAHPELIPDFTSVFLTSESIAVATIALLAAAVSRRLHDRGKTGVWGAMPLPFLAIGMIAMPRFFAATASGRGPDLGAFFLLFFNNMIYIAALLVLTGLLALKGQPNINRFGAPSTASG